MKVIELVLGLISIIGLTMLSMHLDLSAIITATGMLPLAILYLIFSFALLNRIRLRNAFRKSSFQHLSATQILGSIVYGIVLAICVVAIFFKVNKFPGANLMLRAGLMGLVLGITVASFNYIQKKDSKAYFPLLIRTLVFFVPVLWLIMR